MSFRVCETLVSTKYKSFTLCTLTYLDRIVLNRFFRLRSRSLWFSVISFLSIIWQMKIAPTAIPVSDDRASLAFYLCSISREYVIALFEYPWDCTLHNGRGFVSAKKFMCASSTVPLGLIHATTKKCSSEWNKIVSANRNYRLWRIPCFVWISLETIGSRPKISSSRRWVDGLTHCLHEPSLMTASASACNIDAHGTDHK